MKKKTDVDDAVDDFRALLGLYDEDPLLASFFMDDIENIIEISGIRLFKFSEHPRGKPLPKCFGKDGAAGYIGPIKYIALNDLDNCSGRVLFTLLHEYGHFVLNHFSVFEYFPQGLNSAKLHSLYLDLENEANSFASKVLMPETALRNYINSNRNTLAKYQQYNGKVIDSIGIGGITGRFEATWAAVVYRLDDLGIQSKSLSQSLLQTYQVRKQMTKENYIRQTDLLIESFTLEVEDAQEPPVQYETEYIL